MKNITSTRYYNKFVYKVIVRNRWPEIQYSRIMSKSIKKSLLDFKTWINANIPLDSVKIVSKDGNDIVGRLPDHYCTYSVYVDSYVYFCDKNDFDKFTEKYSDVIIDTYEPFNDEHAQLLLDKVNIEFRNHIFYKKYKYRIHLKYSYTYWHTEKELENMLSMLHDDAVTDQNYKFIPYDYTLYLKNEADVIQIKIAYSDYIRRYTMIVTPEEFIE